MRHASTRADLGFWLLNNLATGSLIGWALLSYPTLSHAAEAMLDRGFGPAGPPLLEGWQARAVQTVALYLAYEFAYWLDHYTSHTIRILWEFHRVHHTAETLTPLTAARVHPVESIKFANIMAIVLAITGALAGRATGGAPPLTVDGTNIVLVAFIFATLHLQHSHLWIAFTGPLGRIFASPAHHQIHHSRDPRHFGCNLGSGLVVFDWLFGTLHVPTCRPQRLRFGVTAEGDRPHGVTGGLLTPFVRAVQACRPLSERLDRQPADLGEDRKPDIVGGR